MLKILLLLPAAMAAVVCIYAAYVFLSYRRIKDPQPLPVEGGDLPCAAPLRVCRLISFNIGFGAYEPDFSFFMDGGVRSWAWSPARLRKNMEAVCTFLAEQRADFFLLQEVDENATRTYHLNECAMIKDAFPAGRFCSVYARNMDSAFLFYPLLQPHGKTRSGIITLSGYRVGSALRRSLPVEKGPMKLVDLDRCYSVSRVPVNNGRTLVMYNVHLSAYTKDGSIATEQLRLLLADMAAEYEKGNYAVCGGDFNKDLLGDSSRFFGVSKQQRTWAQSFPEALLDGLPLRLAAPSNAPSCRTAGAPCQKGQFVLTVDGFIVSDNVTVQDAAVLDTGFGYSDHNPVQLTFILKE